MGDMPWNDHGKYMTIWEMQDDGSLKVKVETWNTDVNPVDGNAEDGRKLLKRTRRSSALICVCHCEESVSLSSSTSSL